MLGFMQSQTYRHQYTSRNTAGCTIPAKCGVFIAAGNALNSCTQLMPIYTLWTGKLLSEQLLALKAHNADGFKHLLKMGLQNWAWTL